ncbi:MAG: hypothetical protein JW862_16175 [Anaerolineales bacterium]|nr:hypothetical protein [Anaerolineales bacterium]
MLKNRAIQLQVGTLLAPLVILLIAYGIDRWLMSLRMAPWNDVSNIVLAWAPPLANLLIASLLLIQAWLVIAAANRPGMAGRIGAAFYLIIGLLFGLILPGVVFSFPGRIFIPYDHLLGRLVYPDTVLYTFIFNFLAVSGAAGLSVRRLQRV